MTRYTRSVIPGRQGGEGGRELDQLMFGKRNERTAANDMSEADDEAEPIPDDEADSFVARANPDRRKGRRRKADYKPLPDSRSGYRPPNEGNGRGPLLLIGALIVVGVFGVVVFNAYRDGVRSEEGETPTLASAGPFKTKPVEVAPARIAAGEQASVFDRVDSGRKQAAAEDASPAPDVRVEEKAAPAPVQTAAAPPATKTVAPAPRAALPSPEPKPPVPKVVQAAAAPAIAPAPAPAAPVELAGGYKPVFLASGPYLVQIGAASSEAGADTEWSRRAKASPGLFGSAEKVIVRADVNGKTVYRVRAGAFANAADADAFCSAFKATGGDCFRTAR